VCTSGLQILSTALKSCWAFSIALESSTHKGHSYLGTRVRFWVGSVLYNFHLLAGPLYDRHTGKEMFLTLKKVMDALFKGWSRRIIAVSTDGARSMTGGSRGLRTRIQRICSPVLIRLWCGLHQLDLVMQRIVCAASDETFYAALTNVIGHLRRQQNLIAEMPGTCPLVAKTRCMSMANVSTWLTESSHRARIIRHLDTRNPSLKPSICWWITLHAVNALAKSLYLYLCRSRV
jgi:hypothetical protein